MNYKGRGARGSEYQCAPGLRVMVLEFEGGSDG
jgi:hypothetical protein